MLALDKPAGWTSHDVVARVRRMLGGVKVGHAGTLDPHATGVLVLCLGKATKISAFLMEAEKEYRGTGRLGVSTDTQDATGTVIAERAVDVEAEEVCRAASRFVGRIEQVPPMFSAVKIGGQKLYRLARRGVEVERPARVVTVHAFEVCRVELPEFEFRLCCSKGTYVRTLVHDLGEALGCGASLGRLTRVRQGGFRLEDALPGAVLNSRSGGEELLRRSASPEEALAFLPSWELSARCKPLRVGRLLEAPEAQRRRGDSSTAAEAQRARAGSLVRIVDSSGDLEGIGRLGHGGLRVLYRFPARVGFGRGKRAG